MSRDVSGDYARLVLTKSDPATPNEDRVRTARSIGDRLEALVQEISDCSKEAPELALPLAELKAAQVRIVEALDTWKVR